MTRKKIAHALLFPHIALLLLFLPLAAASLAYGFCFLAQTDPIRIASYVFSFYTLTVWCVRIPRIIRFFRDFGKNNRYASRYLNDAHLRTKITLSLSILYNGAYAALQLGLGIRHHAFWFYSLSAYYFSLALMRFFLARHLLRYSPGEVLHTELKCYGICGRLFLFLNLALSVMIFGMIWENRTVRHHEITTIAIATYTFTALTLAILNVIRYRKYQSPVFSASKAISLCSACVSLLTLEASMLVTFGEDTMTDSTRRLFLSLSGGAISVFIVAMAVYMIVKSNQRIKNPENQHG